MLLGSNDRGGERDGQGGTYPSGERWEDAVSEPLMKCRKGIDVTKTRLLCRAQDEAQGVPADCSSGDRHEGGVSPAQALVRNVGTCCLDVKGELQVVEP